MERDNDRSNCLADLLSYSNDMEFQAAAALGRSEIERNMLRRVAQTNVDSDTSGRHSTKSSLWSPGQIAGPAPLRSTQAEHSVLRSDELTSAGIGRAPEEPSVGTHAVRPGQQPSAVRGLSDDARSDDPAEADDYDLRRSSADAEIIRLVRTAGRSSQMANDLLHEFREQGVGMLLLLYKRGQLFRRLTRLRIYVPTPVPHGFHAAAGSLLHLSVYEAVPVFIDKFIFGDEWDPSRSSSLKTCLVNTCLYQFSIEYRRFCRSEGRKQLEVVDEINKDSAQQPLWSQAGVDTDDRFDQNEHINELILSKSLIPEEKLLLIRNIQGFTQREIADEFGITEAAASSRIRRLKKKLEGLRHEAQD
jgi:DNA-binding CsgD family transcriptional regulator